MSTGNKWVDDAIASAGGLLAAQWKNSPRMVQPENNLHPDASQLQFRVKLLEDRVTELERFIGARSNVGTVSRR